MLTVQLPPGHEDERRYILHVVLGEWLGLDFTTVQGSEGIVRITSNADNGRRVLEIRDGLLRCPAAQWLTPASLPALPLDTWEAPAEIPLVDQQLPVLFGAREYLAETGERLFLGIDLFGAIFFLLTRYEEVAAPVHDADGRFPGKASVAAIAGFLLRPLADEYVEVLWWALGRQWPRLERKPRRYALALTHDVDRPFDVLEKPRTAIARGLLAEAVRAPGVAWEHWRMTRQVWRVGADADPGYQLFTFFMAQSEALGLTSTFNFLSAHEDPIDANYTLDDPSIRQVLRLIRDRGHIVGFHGGYHTYRNGERLVREIRALQRVAEEEGVTPAVWGGRQHYLRWEAPTTWRLWAQAGLAVDSTLGFADLAGFRCGTCHAFPVWDLQARARLALVETPLIAMDMTLLSKNAMGCSPEQCYQVVTTLATHCRRVAGTFVLLWHNTLARTAEQRQLYSTLLRAIAS